VISKNTYRRTWLPALLAVPLAMSALSVVLAGQRAEVRQREEQQREQWQKVAQIFEAMGVRPGAAVADVGAGWGFFTSRLSRIVGPSGRVVAIDIDEGMIATLRTRAQEEALGNVEIVKGDAGDTHLSDGFLDAVLIVNAYHEMREHQAMLDKIRRALKPDGHLVIVEPISPTHRADSREALAVRHEITPEFALDDARAAGYRIASLQDPFTRERGSSIEWMLVLTPDPDARPAAVTFVASSNASAPTNTSGLSDAANADAWKAPALRISLSEFKRLLAKDAVMVLDVRDDESYRLGHVPGARLVPLDALADHATELRAISKLIVAYCS
jgi:protein-L-isoaspartate O-methyltransferase